MSKIVEHRGYLLVQVLDKSKGHFIMPCLGNYLLSFNTDWGHDGSCEITLPPGKYYIIGLASTLSEKDWEEIVERVVVDPFYPMKGPTSKSFKDYLATGGIVTTSPGHYSSPTAAGLSLLARENLKAENCLILKKL